jgi:hypothetical protein
MRDEKEQSFHCVRIIKQDKKRRKRIESLVYNVYQVMKHQVSQRTVLSPVSLNDENPRGNDTSLEDTRDTGKGYQNLILAFFLLFASLRLSCLSFELKLSYSRVS